MRRQQPSPLKGATTALEGMKDMGKPEYTSFDEFTAKGGSSAVLLSSSVLLPCTMI